MQPCGRQKMERHVQDLTRLVFFLLLTDSGIVSWFLWLVKFWGAKKWKG